MRDDSFDIICNEYVKILKDNLLISTGCTEPSAVAYAASIITRVLGKKPSLFSVKLSKNILKNTKSVIIPNTGGLTGIEIAICAGVISNKYELGLNVLSELDDYSIPFIWEYAKKTTICIMPTNSKNIFEIDMIGQNDDHSASVKMIGSHTNIVYVKFDGKEVSNSYKINEHHENVKDDSKNDILNFLDIINFARKVPLSMVENVLRKQIEYNLSIAEEGLNRDYETFIGKILLKDGNISLKEKAKAYAAAASDARMNGSKEPVCIISGSGNQGIAASLPVIVYAKELGKTENELFRALIVSDMITIFQKSRIGCLSAYCGAISAGCGSACGICFLCDGSTEEISRTLVNSIAIISGTICDGAKPSCAAKIAMAVESGILGYEMAKNGIFFKNGQGIVSKNVEKTIANVGILANVGMEKTDDTIIKLMFESIGEGIR